MKSLTGSSNSSLPRKNRLKKKMDKFTIISKSKVHSNTMRVVISEIIDPIIRVPELKRQFSYLEKKMFVKTIVMSKSLRECLKLFGKEKLESDLERGILRKIVKEVRKKYNVKRRMEDAGFEKTEVSRVEVEEGVLGVIGDRLLFSIFKFQVFCEMKDSCSEEIERLESRLKKYVRQKRERIGSGASKKKKGGEGNENEKEILKKRDKVKAKLKYICEKENRIDGKSEKFSSTSTLKFTKTFLGRKNRRKSTEKKKGNSCVLVFNRSSKNPKYFKVKDIGKLQQHMKFFRTHSFSAKGKIDLDKLFRDQIKTNPFLKKSLTLENFQKLMRFYEPCGSRVRNDFKVLRELVRIEALKKLGGRLSKEDLELLELEERKKDDEKKYNKELVDLLERSMKKYKESKHLVKSRIDEECGNFERELSKCMKADIQRIKTFYKSQIAKITRIFQRLKKGKIGEIEKCEKSESDRIKKNYLKMVNADEQNLHKVSSCVRNSIFDYFFVEKEETSSQGIAKEKKEDIEKVMSLLMLSIVFSSTDVKDFLLEYISFFFRKKLLLSDEDNNSYFMFCDKFRNAMISPSIVKSLLSKISVDDLYFLKKNNQKKIIFPQDLVKNEVTLRRLCKREELVDMSLSELLDLQTKESPIQKQNPIFSKVLMMAIKKKVGKRGSVVLDFKSCSNNMKSSGNGNSSCEVKLVTQFSYGSIKSVRGKTPSNHGFLQWEVTIVAFRGDNATVSVGIDNVKRNYDESVIVGITPSIHAGLCGVVIQSNGILLENGRMEVLEGSKFSIREFDVVGMGLKIMEKRCAIQFFVNGKFVVERILCEGRGNQHFSNCLEFFPVCGLYQWGTKVQTEVAFNFGQSRFKYPIKNFLPYSS